MEIFRDARSQAVYFLAREIGERLVPPLSLQPRAQASLIRAQQLDSEEGNFTESAQEFFTILQRSEEPEERAEALIGVSQQLINLGKFRQAKGFLDIAVDKIQTSFSGGRSDEILLEAPRAYYFWAREQEKRGWIADYESGYRDEIGYLNQARQYLNYIPRIDWREEEKEVYSTTTHFLGRAHFGLASQGINPSQNLVTAREFFRRDLTRFERMRTNNNPRPANEGFQYAWLARSYIMEGRSEKAQDQIDQAENLFREFIQANPRRGILHIFTF